MHPTADTLLLIYPQSLGAAGDAGRYALVSFGGCLMTKSSVSQLLGATCFLTSAAFALPSAGPPPPPASQESRSDSDAKRDLYDRFLKSYKTDQPEAARAAKLYLERYATDEDKVAEYLRRWVRRYDKATGADGFQELSIACGVSVTSREYLTRDGRRLYRTERRFGTAELAEAALEQRVQAAGGAVQREPLPNGGGAKARVRAVIRGAKGVEVLRLEGEKMVVITAPSAELIEEFEKAGRP